MSGIGRTIGLPMSEGTGNRGCPEGRLGDRVRSSRYPLQRKKDHTDGLFFFSDVIALM